MPVQLNFLELENLSSAENTSADSSSQKGVCAPSANPSLPSAEIEALKKARDEYIKSATNLDKKISCFQKKQKTLEEKKRKIEWQTDSFLRRESDAFIEEMKKANRNFAYIQVQYVAGVDYYGNHHYRITCEHAEELIDKGINPFTGKENSYGGMWGYGGPELDEATPLNRDVGVVFLQQLLDYKKDFLKKPYLNPADGWQFTSIKGLDYRIFFDKKVVELFSKHGDIEKFIQRFNSLDNQPPTEEELNTAGEYYRLEKEIEKLEKKDGIKQAVRYLFNLGAEYGCWKAEMPMELAGKSPDELYQLYQERSRRLEETKTRFEEIRKKIWE